MKKGFSAYDIQESVRRLLIISLTLTFVAGTSGGDPLSLYLIQIGSVAKFIIHAPWQRSPFTRASLKTLESIGALEQFMLKHRKDYVDLHRTTEQEMDSIEHEQFVKEKVHEQKKSNREVSGSQVVKNLQFQKRLSANKT